MRVQPAALRGGGAGTGSAAHAVSGRRLSDTPGTVTPPPGDAIDLDFTTVQTAVTNCPPGGTVLLKPGSVDWGQMLVINQPMTLRGAGRDLTSISDALGKQNIIEANTTTAGPIRICHIGFIGGIQNRASAPANTAGVYVIVARGQGKIRVDHCKFTCTAIPAGPPVPPQSRAFSAKDGITGVFDNNLCIGSGGLRAAVNTNHDVWKGVGAHGDNSWAQPVNFGSDEFIYYEDNQWEVAAGFDPLSAWGHDAWEGGRCVIRYNKMYNINWAAHGTEAGGRGRGVRAMEVYNNIAYDRTLTRDAVFCDLRSGQLIIFNNTTGSGITGLARADNNRSRHSFTWCASDGACGWDFNDTTGGPNGNGIYYQGTCKEGSTNGLLVDPGNTWPANLVAGGFSVHDVDTDDGGLIETQAADRLTFLILNASVPDPVPHFHPGDVYQIRKCIYSFDAPGRGSGNLISGNPPVQTPTWMNQPTDPCYAWNNTIDGAPGVITTPVDAHVVEGRDFFNGTPKPGYTPYTYPHPMRTSGPTADP